MSVTARFLPALGRKLWKQVQRYRDMRESLPPLDVRKLETSMMYALVIRSAEQLGLTHRFVGPMLCIEDAEGGTFRLVANCTDLDSLPVCELCGDKVATCELLNAVGLETPQGRVFASSQVAAALAYAQQFARSCVVKPAVGTGGEAGVTAPVEGSRSIRSAFARAALYCDRVLLEEWVPGDDYRFLIYRGTCISALRRNFGTVVGTGTDTIAALIAKENSSRINGNQWRVGDPIWMPLCPHRNGSDALSAQGLTLASKPARGTTVRLTGTNYRLGATHEEVLHYCHPAVVRAAETAAKALSVQLAGIDIRSTDISQSACRIIEVNTTPALWFHYFISNPEMGRDPIRTILQDRLRVPRPVELESVAVRES